MTNMMVTHQLKYMVHARQILIMVDIILHTITINITYNTQTLNRIIENNLTEM